MREASIGVPVAPSVAAATHTLSGPAR